MPCTALYALDHQHRQGRAGEVCPLTPELAELCRAAARAVGGGVLAIDVLEDPQRGYLVNEVNHTMEFHGLAPVTHLDIAGMIVDYTLAVGAGKIALKWRFRSSVPCCGLLDRGSTFFLCCSVCRAQTSPLDFSRLDLIPAS